MYKLRHLCKANTNYLYDKVVEDPFELPNKDLFERNDIFLDTKNLTDRN